MPYSKVTSIQDSSSDHFPTFLELKCKPNYQEIKHRGKWKIIPEKWTEWRKILEKTDLNLGENNEENIYKFTEPLTNASKEVFKLKNGTKKSKYNAIWWNQDCSKARAERRRARNKLKRQYTPDNLINLKRTTAIAKRTFKQAKKYHWKNFCNKLTAETPTSKIWSTCKAMDKKE